MKNYLVYIGLTILISCSHTEDNARRKELGLLVIDSNWKPNDTLYFLTYDSIKGKVFKRLSKSERQKSNHIAEYWESTSEDSFARSKILYFDLVNGQRKITKEIDVYEKGFSKWTKVQLEILYNYSNDSVSSRIDTTSTKYAYERKKFILDSLNAYAERNNVMICGTAASEIISKLTSDVPYLSIPHEIPIGKAQAILATWTREKK